MHFCDPKQPSSSFKYIPNTWRVTFPPKHTHTQPCGNMQVDLSLSPQGSLPLIWFGFSHTGRLNTAQFLEFLTLSAFAGSCCCLSPFYRLSPGISTPIGGRDSSDIISAGFPLWLTLELLSHPHYDYKLIATHGISWTNLCVCAGHLCLTFVSTSLSVLLCVALYNNHIGKEIDMMSLSILEEMETLLVPLRFISMSFQMETSTVSKFANVQRFTIS